MRAQMARDPSSDTPAPRRRLVVDAHKGLGPLALAGLGCAVGLVAGAGAVVFRGLIALVHNALFLGKLSWSYDTLQHTPASPWGIAVVLVFVLGGLVVVFLVRNFAPEAKGHGVPEVVDAIYYGKAAIRPVVAVIKSVASAISIGSGGSVGREGPIIQIGAAFGSWAGRVCGVSRWQLATLVAAGGGAGIAATFNTPIGGVLFAVEILMHEVSVRTLVPVALATATATYVGHFVFGDHPAFPVPAVHTTVAFLPAYLTLGALMALVSVLFIRMLYATEDLFEKRVPGKGYLRHALGMAVVGAISVALLHTTGHYQVEGVGYATIIDVISGATTSVALLLVLFGLKLCATSLTLGSGASGGIFSPALFMGTTLGAAFGIVLRRWFPGSGVDPAAFALAGMAGVVAGSTGAALTAIVMIFEMTLDYGVVLPMTLTVTVAFGLRRMFLADSIYSMKLSRRGHYIPQALQANPQLVHHIGDVDLEKATVLPGDAKPDPVALLRTKRHIVLVDGDRVVGVLSPEWVLGHADALGVASTLADVAEQDFVMAPSDSTLFNLLRSMQTAHSGLAVVISAAGPLKVMGVATMAHLAEVVAEGMEMFGD